MSLTESNRPLRVVEKILKGGLGEGNIGVVMSRRGTGKVAVMTSIAIDHAMSGRQTLHVAMGERLSDVRAYDDEVLSEMLDRFATGEDRGRVMTEVERNKQIYTYADGSFSASRLRRTLEFLADHAEFRPHLIELQGWPDIHQVTEDEMRALKNVAVEFKCEIWCTANITREEENGQVPECVGRFDDLIAVIVALEPKGSTVNLRFLKTHDTTPPKDAHLEFDPSSLLIRWR